MGNSQFQETRASRDDALLFAQATLLQSCHPIHSIPDLFIWYVQGLRYRGFALKMKSFGWTRCTKDYVREFPECKARGGCIDLELQETRASRDDAVLFAQFQGRHAYKKHPPPRTPQ